MQWSKGSISGVCVGVCGASSPAALESGPATFSAMHRISLGVCMHLTSLQRGYMLNERVVRAAEVGVTRAQD